MINVHTNFKHCDILLGHSMLQLCSVVIFDNFVVFSVQVLLVVLYTDLLLCNKSDRYISFFWVCSVGLGARSVVDFSRGSLCVWRSPLKLFRIYLGMVTSFGARLCWGGGG